MKPASLKPSMIPFAAAFLSSSDPLRKREKSMSCIGQWNGVGWGGVLELTGMNKLSSDTAVDTAWAAIGSVFYVLDKRERKSGQLFQTDSPWTNKRLREREVIASNGRHNYSRWILCE